MSKKITLVFNSNSFDINLDDEFATYFIDDMKKDFNVSGNNEVKKLLRLYVAKSHKLFLQERKTKQIIKQLEGN